MNRSNRFKFIIGIAALVSVIGSKAGNNILYLPANAETSAKIIPNPKPHPLVFNVSPKGITATKRGNDLPKSSSMDGAKPYYENTVKPKNASGEQNVEIKAPQTPVAIQKNNAEQNKPLNAPDAEKKPVETKEQPKPYSVPLPPGAIENSLPPAVVIRNAKPISRPDVPREYSKYAVLMDVRTGKLLWERNPNVKRPMASTTKMMTATLLLEKCKPDGVVVAPAGIDKVEESSLHLTPGESITVHDLLYAMMLRSANDTAVAGAVYEAGSVPAFVEEMNAKAKEIGALNTHFVTPNGLYDKNHYSTAYDLALIARYAIQTQPEFSKIIKTQRYKVKRSIHKDDAVVKNTAYTFLRTFPGADGIKTGYVSQAGHCFVGSATRNGWRLIAVALKSNACREDVVNILDYGFSNFRLVQPLRNAVNIGYINVPTAARSVQVMSSGDFIVPLPRWKDIPEFRVRLIPDAQMPAAPIKKGTKLGIYQIMANGYVQGSGDMIAAEDVEAKPAIIIQAKVKNASSKAVRIGCAIVGGIMLFILGGRIYARTRALAKSAGGSRNRIPASLRRID